MRYINTVNNNSDEQYRLSGASGYLGYCVEKTILKILIFFNKKYEHVFFKKKQCS